MKTPVKPNQRTAAKSKGFKYTKPIVVTAVSLAVVIAAVIILPKVLGGNAAVTRITTYNVDEVAYGNVTQTISGSGTLTPLLRKHLHLPKAVRWKKSTLPLGMRLLRML